MFYTKFVHDVTFLLTRFHLMGGADIVSSLQDPKYKIDYHPAESPVLPVPSLSCLRCFSTLQATVDANCREN